MAEIKAEKMQKKSHFANVSPLTDSGAEISNRAQMNRKWAVASLIP